MKIQEIQRIMNPRLFQKHGNIPSLNRNLKSHRGVIEDAPTFHSFKLCFFSSVFRKVLLTYLDSFWQDMNYKLCSLNQQPNQYIYSRNKVMYAKSFLEHREPVQPPTSRRLRLICTLRHAPYILLGEGTVIVSNVWCQMGLQLWAKELLWLPLTWRGELCTGFFDLGMLYSPWGPEFLRLYTEGKKKNREKISIANHNQRLAQNHPCRSVAFSTLLLVNRLGRSLILFKSGQLRRLFYM